MNAAKNHLNPLTETNQTWLDLAAIQFSGWMGIPILSSSILILQQNSFPGAILTIIVGNAIMWFIRLGILSMSFEKRQSTLDLSRAYMGNLGGYFISVLLLISTFAWYITQTSIGGNSLTHLITIHENPQINQFAQVSVFLGMASAFLCMEGMALLRRLSLFSLPILVITFFVILFTIPNGIPEMETKTLSLAGLSIFLATNLGISSDLPTFFRHGQTWTASLKALTLIQIVNVVFGILGLYFGALVINHLQINEQLVISSGSEWLRYALILFIFFSVLCANVANVYSASVGWEILAPSSLVGRKEYLILGLGLTILFILVSDLFSIDFLLAASDAALVNLCLILTIGYVVARKQKNPPNRYLQRTYFIAWGLSSLINSIQFLYETALSPLLLSAGTMAAVLALASIGKKRF